VFADSADTPNDPFCAIIEGKLIPFFVIEEDGTKEGEVSIVSLDGTQILRRPSTRQVMKIPGVFLDESGQGQKVLKARLSNAEDGGVVDLTDSKVSYMKVQGNPTPVGKVILVRLIDGIKSLVDDDLLVTVRDSISVNFELCFKKP